MSNFQTIEDALTRLAERINFHNNEKTAYLLNQSPMDIFTIEKDYFSKLMTTYPNCTDITLKVDKLSTISYLKNRYSVPDYLVLKHVDVKVYINKLDIYYNNTLVATHTRLYVNQQWDIEILHYTKTLSRKPGALVGSLAFKQMDSYLKELYHNHFKNSPKSFIELLELIGNNDIDSIKRVIDILTQKSVPVNTENIKMILNRNEDTVSNQDQSDMQKQIEENSRKHLSLYDEIVGTNYLKEDVAI